MAEKSSWTDLLADLIRGFILLRDVFGYMLPGAVFLFIGVYSGHLRGAQEICKGIGLGSSPWMIGLLLAIACYVCGQFLAAAVYFLPDLVGVFKSRGADPTTKGAGSKEASELLYYRTRFPDVFIELDRRSIIALLRTGLAGALIVGLAVFYWLYAYPKVLLAVGGVVMVFNSYTAGRHIGDMRATTLLAARGAEKSPTATGS